MNTSEFLALLAKQGEQSINYHLTDGTKIHSTYHITEIKKIAIESVDCGGRPATDRQTMVQLWVPKGAPETKAMSAQKAYSIFKKVDDVNTLYKDAELVFEYSDSEHPTSIFHINEITSDENGVNVLLGTKPTACKPMMEQLEAICCSTPSCCS